MKYVLIAAVATLLGVLAFRAAGGGSAPSAAPSAALPNRPATSAAGKLTLLDFTGSDWCVWCQRLDREVFSHPEFQQYARENLIFTKVDFPRSFPQSPAERAQNTELARKYGIKGFPTIVVLNSQGKEVGRLGYMPGGPKPFLDALRRLPNS